MLRLTHPGWRGTLAATLAFLVIPSMPTSIASTIPISETWVLLAGVLAVCAALGWWHGGGGAPAIIAATLAALALSLPIGASGGAYASLARGWTFLLAAAFGVASLLTPRQPFLPRALVAIGIATAAALALAVAQPREAAGVRAAISAELSHRTEGTIAEVESVLQDPQLQKWWDTHPAMAAQFAKSEAELRTITHGAVPLAPALLALESLAALALAWSLYHRVAGTALGPMLGTLREFRFNDQLVWGLALGATIYFLPVFADAAPAGLNLLLFFGALYLLRGLGVLSWMTRNSWMAVGLVALTFFAFQIVAALALGVGVADTWMDWRSRAQPAS